MTGAKSGPRSGQEHAATKSDNLNPITMTPFCKLPYAVLSRSDLSATAKVVFSYLLDRQGHRTVCWPSLNRIANDCGTTKPAVSRAIADLKNLRLIAVRRPRPGERGRSNRYRISKAESPSSATNRRAKRLRVVGDDGNVSYPYSESVEADQ